MRFEAGSVKILEALRILEDSQVLGLRSQELIGIVTAAGELQAFRNFYETPSGREIQIVSKLNEVAVDGPTGFDA
ncbi:hypothetical protein FF1_004876 [Malus domestica]